jgi:hypothetical protein
MPGSQNLLKNTAGFSLIEVMIASVLLIAVLFGMAGFNKIGSNIVMSTELNTDFVNLSSTMLYTLSSSKLCTEALGNGISPGAEQPFDPLASPIGIMGTMQVGGTNGVAPSPMASLGPVPGSMGGLNITKLQFNQIYGQYTTPSGTNFLANLYLEAQKFMPGTKTPFLGAPTLSRNFLVNVNVDTVNKKVVGCN